MRLKQKITKTFIDSKRFVYFVVRHFFNDDCPYRASALAFTTLLAIVPLMAVSFVILSTFPMFQRLAKPAQDFIFANFVPSTGKIVQNYLIDFTNHASKLSTIGMVFLFIIALLMMYTIESAMNKIWRAPSSRHRLLAFLLYGGIVSLTPFLLGISLLVSSYVFSIPFLAQQDIPTLLSYLPFIFSLAGFTFLYIVVPNCPIRIAHGFYGGLTAAFLFEAAKHVFGYYLTHYHTYQLLYGAFATVPIFFIWIYWVWIITLLGAEVSYAFSVHHQRRQELRLDGEASD
jgi:membrane protein